MKISFKSTIASTVKFLLCLIASVSILYGLIWLKTKIDTAQEKTGIEVKQAAVVKEDFFSGFLGENITYDVKLGGLTLGKAIFNHVSRVRLQEREVNFMTFETSLARFKDLEKIYSDMRTFLPIRVEREVFIWSNHEKITESYDQDKFTLNINKVKGGVSQDLVIKKDGTIHNAILLPFHVRMMPKLDIGWSMNVRLPTQDFLIKLVSIEEVTVPAGTFKAYRFDSTPSKFQIWVSADERKIPLKIKGLGFLGYTLVMRDYSL